MCKFTPKKVPNMYSHVEKLNLLTAIKIFILWSLLTSTAHAAEFSEEMIKQYSTTDPFSFILMEFGFIVILALIGHALSKHYRLPNMLGELVIGVLTGNILYWLDWSPVFYILMHLGDAGTIFKSVWTSHLSVAETVTHYYVPNQSYTKEFVDRLAAVFTSNQSPGLVLLGVALWMFSNFGVFLLLFKLGLETKTEKIIKAADPLAFLVSVTGTLVPFLLGLSASVWLLPESKISEHIFIAAALCTTSAAITTSIFSRLKKLHTREAQIVIHAAFLDDIFGVFFLSYITDIVLGETLNVSEIIILFFYSSFVFVGIIIAGKYLVRYIPKYYNFDELHTRILIPILLVVIVSWLADLFGVGIISSAFIAGMILNNMSDKKRLISALITPLEKIFAPIFFVFVGMQVNLQQFVNPEILWLTIVLLIVAISGKVFAGFVTKQNINRLAIGAGMIPRGEAVLIFISIGKILGVIDDSMFSIITVIVLITNFVAPWTINRFYIIKSQDENFVIK